MILNLAYGKSGYIFELSDKYHIDIIEPLWVEGVNNQSLAIVKALNEPYGGKPLKQLAGKNDKVAIIFSDITRATPYHIILPSLLNELQNIPQENISFYCANGTHRLASDQELIDILGEAVYRNYKIVQNDANDINQHKYVGTTVSGNEVFLNRKILDCKLKILTGFIEPHFFAGFSGGGKALVPGMAFAGTIKYNHSISHLSSESATWGITDGNPIWEEIMEAAGFVPGLFLLNITLNRNKEITNVFAGDLVTAHKAGCQFVKESAMVPVDNLYDIVITSNSGHPLDLNIYQAVKGMSAASQIVRKGGSIIIAAECRDGIPSKSDYERILTSVKHPGGLMNYIKENETNLKDTWQIYYQAMIQHKAEVYLFSKSLDDETIKKALLNPAGDIGRLVDDLARRTGPEVKICILPEGPMTIPYLK